MGHNLILVARKEQDLISRQNELSALGVEVVIIAKDLFDPNAAAELYQEVKNQRLQVEILINDAGQGQYGLLLKTISAAISNSFNSTLPRLQY